MCVIFCCVLLVFSFCYCFFKLQLSLVEGFFCYFDLMLSSLFNGSGWDIMHMIYAIN